LVAALYKLGKFESRYAEYVHDMRCHEGPYGACDFGRAVGNWQTWLDSNERRLVKGKDYQSTAYAALFAAEKFAKARRACGTLEGAFAMYATGKRCEWKGAPRRARETLAFMERMPWVVVDSASREGVLSYGHHRQSSRSQAQVRKAQQLESE